MKTVKLLVLATIIFGFLLYKFYYYDPAYGCQITIIPSFLPSNTNTKTILKMIKKGSPDDYLRLCKYVRVINKNPSCGGLDGGCFKPSKPKTIYTGNDQANIALSASILVHETCHAIQATERSRLSEPECYSVSNRYLNEVTVY